MRRSLYGRYLATRYDLEVTGEADGDVVTGWLVSRADGERIAIRGGIPRFVDDDGYAGNFALQWTEFRVTQLDSHTGLELYERRFRENTRWTDADLAGRTVLEVGSGAGAFTEVLLATGAQVVSVDLSTAVDANRSSNDNDALLLLQADVYDLPLEPCSFDFVFCYGVLQHTPDPDAAYRALWSMVRPGGHVSIDHYAKVTGLSPWYQPKYAWRPITTRMRPDLLLRVISIYVPLWLPIDTMLRRIPRIGPKLLGFLRIPCWNHNDLGLGRRESRRWAVMNTFDALGAAYDLPKSQAEVAAMVTLPDAVDVEVFPGSNGYVANARKAQ